MAPFWLFGELKNFCSQKILKPGHYGATVQVPVKAINAPKYMEAL
jgi:hypothetical protein